MSTFMDGFTDELEKLGGVASAAGKAVSYVAKHPLKTIGTALLVGAPAYAGYQGAKGAWSKKKERVIHARPGRPSQLWGINFNRLIGKKQLSKLEKERLSRHFARYRERK